jgi:uncharacterized membrane protein YgdD (TMEM256/DUF423 family)
MEFIKKSQSFAESGLDYTLSNPYLMAVVKVTLVLYATQLAPKAPEYLQTAFKNTFVKLFAVMMIAYLGEKDLQLAILIAIIYVFGMNLLSGRNFFESFTEFTKEYVPFGTTKMIEPKTHLYPGCENVTMDDLYKMFEGDQDKMQEAVQYSFKELMRQTKSKDSKDKLIKIAYAVGLPYNLSFDNPETAPYIATLLVNYNFVVNDKCQPPK